MGFGTPTGTVTFSVDGVAQPPVATTANGLTATARFTASKLAIGMHTIAAVYGGDASATPSESSGTDTIQKSFAIVSVADSALYSAPGQPISLTAYVTAPTPAAGVPTGTVNFTFSSGADIVRDVGSPLPPVVFTESATLVPSPTITGGATARIITSALTARDSYSVRATYSGDATFDTASDFFVQTVGDATTTTLGVPAGPSVAGQPATFTAVVTTTGPASGLTGGVIFTIDNVPQRPASLVASSPSSLQATARFVTEPLAAGPHLITAAYSGTNSNAQLSTAQSVSNPFFFRTVPGSTVPTRTVVTATPDVPAVGRPYVLIATVAGAAPLPTLTPTGVAEFLDGGVPVANVPLDANGQAVLYLPSLRRGPHSFSVVYSGDANDGLSVGVVSPGITGVRRAGPGNALDVVVDFGGGPLDPSSARDAKNYRVTGSSGRGIKVRSATYNATASSVTLRLASRLIPQSTYQLQVIGTGSSGVRGASGSLLAGVGVGLAGTDYQGAISGPTPVRPKVKFQARATTTHPQGRLAAQLHGSTRPAHAPMAR